MSNFIDMTGNRYGHLVVVALDSTSTSTKHRKWICKCDCGNTKSVFRDALIAGKTKSCGCMQYADKKGINRTHGMSKTRIYREWVSMRKRCRPDSNDSKTYYHRGISVCLEWNDFITFYEWAVSHGYDDSLSIDRIDNNKGYSPENCRWIPIEQQQSNKSNNVYVIYEGKKYCVKQLSDKLGLPYKTICRRYHRLLKKYGEVPIDKLIAPIKKDRVPFEYRQS